MTDQTTKDPTSERTAVLDEYAKLSPGYDEKWSFYVEATTRETLARLSLTAGERVLDVGCGTGVLLERLAARHDPSSLVGAEPVPEMLARARQRLPGEVELCQAWAEELPFPDADFDVVISCNMFHYIRRPHAALAEMRRVLRPGGRLLLTDWCHDFLTCRICDWYLRRTDPAHYHTYRAGECRKLLAENGFQVQELDRYKISWLWGLMTVQAKRGS